MGKIVPIEMDLESSPGRYGPDSGGRLINAVPEYAGEKGKLRYPIYPIEGLKSFATLTGGGAVRGAVELEGYGYVVAGTGVFKVDSDGNVTTLGSFGGANPVFMVRNRASPGQILMVSDGLRYTIISDTVASISNSDLPAGNSATFIEGYGVVTISDGRFFISAIDDFTSWDALDFAEAQGQADNLQVGYARGREIALFGTNSIEFWAHTGAADFPFEPNQSTFIRNLGCLCRHSVKDINDVVFFVASDGTVRRLNGYTPESISTHAVERAVASISDKDTIVATAYSLRGHQYYVLSSEEWTWVYDGKTGLWHERASYQLARWRAETYVSISNKNIIGDSVSGLLYELDPDTYDEAGDYLVWIVRTPPIHGYPAMVGMDRLFVDNIPGTGLNSANPHEAVPLLMMRYSDDGAKTWSNLKTASTGEGGQYSKRVKFEQLGQTKEDGRNIEISMSAPVIRGLTGMAVEVEPLEP